LEKPALASASMLPYLLASAVLAEIIVSDGEWGGYSLIRCYSLIRLCYSLGAHAGSTRLGHTVIDLNQYVGVLEANV
jgi:hypothetical protein